MFQIKRRLAAWTPVSIKLNSLGPAHIIFIFSMKMVKIHFVKIHFVKAGTWAAPGPTIVISQNAGELPQHHKMSISDWMQEEQAEENLRFSSVFQVCFFFLKKQLICFILFFC